MDIFFDDGQRSRLSQLTAQLSKRPDRSGLTILEKARLFGRTRKETQRALLHWFSAGADQYTPYSFHPSEYLMRIERYGFASLESAEEQWSTDVPKRLDTFIGGFWLDRTKLIPVND